VYGSPGNISTMLLLLSIGACGLVVGISLALEAIEKENKLASLMPTYQHSRREPTGCSSKARL
jgi:hypothetical protein